MHQNDTDTPQPSKSNPKSIAEVDIMVTYSFPPPSSEGVGNFSAISRLRSRRLTMSYVGKR